MEVYNPYSILQVSEVLTELTVRFGTHVAYQGKAVVISLVNTGLTAVASVTLIDEWSELNEDVVASGTVRAAALAFVKDWELRFQIHHEYQIVVNELRAYLSDVARWVEQIEMSGSMPRVDGKLRADVFYELVVPLMGKLKYFFTALSNEASKVEAAHASSYRAFAQAALHPLLLRSPFVHRAFTKPLGYAGDYQMVNQMLGDPRQGPNTYFQMVNTAFLQASVVVAHRNRIDLLVNFLKRQADAAMQAGRVFRILNVGCGPAIEIQRFLESYPVPELLSFELVDFSSETLEWTRTQLTSIVGKIGKPVSISYVQDSVQQLLRRRSGFDPETTRRFDAVYCAGLFDYLSNKVCARLTAYFSERLRSEGRLLITNVHSNSSEKSGMEHLLEWYLIYRDEAEIASILPKQAVQHQIYVDATGVNVFAEASII